jgi:hypothetical protein
MEPVFSQYFLTKQIKFIGSAEYKNTIELCLTNSMPKELLDGRILLGIGNQR